MKSIKCFLIIVTIVLGVSSTANAQFRWGVRAGVNINSLHFNEKAFEKENQAGFVGGLTTQFTVPVVGVGFDLSALYVRRNAQFMKEHDITTSKRDYIEIPLNLRWNIGLPGVGKLVSPFITTGPSVAFLTSRTAIEDAYKNKTVDWAWNFGLGLQFVNKVQIGASYGLGMSKAVKAVGVDTNKANIEGKNRYWTVTAAYFF